MIKLIRFFILIGGLVFASYTFAEVPVINGYDSSDNNQGSQVVVTDRADNTPAGATHSSALPIKQRVTILERQVSNLTQLLSQVNQLQSQIQDLRGEIEIQKHTIKVLQDQVRSQYQDLDHRLAAQANSTPIKTASTKSANNKPADTDDNDNLDLVTKNSNDKQPTNQTSAVVARTDAKDNDQKTYQAAIDLLKTKKYTQAITAFQKYIKQYPAGQQTNNARFWLGQLYLLQGQPNQALDQFRVVIKKDPNNKKTPDILLQVGLAYYAKGDMTRAQAAFKRVVQKYPNTTAAKLAQTRLKLTQQASVDQTAGGTGTDISNT